MVAEPERKTPKEQKYAPRATSATENGENRENNLCSPRFKSVAAMAGWDEETLLIASLIVDDTPDREFKSKKRSDLTFKTPPSNSRRKRRDHKKSPGPASISATTLNLDEEETAKKEENEKSKTPSQLSSRKDKSQLSSKKDKIKSEKEKSSKDSADSESSNSLPCMDKLREELSCAICLDICFEPSTTPCGHSFCKKCLRSAADKCGKRCPKCRQIISNGRSCTVNTVLWNTIQLLFPNEVAARKASSISETRDAESRTSDRDRNHGSSRRSSLRSANSNRLGTDVNLRRRRGVPAQDDDAAMALRLQREEFMQAIRGRDEDGGRISVSVARANLRAMASRAMNIRIRSRHL